MMKVGVHNLTMKWTGRISIHRYKKGLAEKMCRYKKGYTHFLAVENVKLFQVQTVSVRNGSCLSEPTLYLLLSSV